MGCECLQQVAVESVARLTACDCKAAGFCERHQCVKTDHWVNLCRTKADYFQAWEEGRGPCINKPPPPSVPPNKIGLGDALEWIIRRATFGLLRPWPGCGCHARKSWLNQFAIWGWWRK